MPVRTWIACAIWSAGSKLGPGLSTQKDESSEKLFQMQLALLTTQGKTQKKKKKKKKNIKLQATHLQ